VQIDTKSLPPPDFGPGGGEEYVAASTPLQEQLQGIWMKVGGSCWLVRGVLVGWFWGVAGALVGAAGWFASVLLEKRTCRLQQPTD
jgi:hypothetical protein